MTASIHEIDLATKGAGIRKHELAKLLGVSAAAITRQVAKGHHKVIRIGGAELIRTDAVRAAFGLDQA